MIQRVYRSEWFSNGATMHIDAEVQLPEEAEGWNFEQTAEYCEDMDRWINRTYEIEDANGNRIIEVPDYPIYVTHVEGGLN